MRIGLMIVLLGVFTACTNTPKTTPPPQPPPPPGAVTITASTPADTATGIAVNTNLTVVFSKPMNTTSVSVTAAPTTELGTSAWSDGDTTLTLDPPANLEPGTAYTLTVVGKDTTGAVLADGTRISFTTATAADPPPATPTNPSAKPGNASVTVSWDANTEPDLKNYTVFWGASSSALMDSSAVDKAQTSKTITGLTNGTIYFFALSATDTAGNASARTASISATPVKPPPPGDTTPPAVPKDLDSSNSDKELGLSWTANLEADLKGYNVYLGTTAGSMSFTGFVDKTNTKKKLSGLKNGTTYFYAIDAEDTSGNKSAKTATLHDTPTDRIAPTLVSSAPANGAKNVPVNTDLVLKFSEPMRRDSLEFNQICAASGACLIFNLPVWSDGDTTATLKPAKLLDGNRDYTLTLGAKDKAGNALVPTPIRFTTIGPKLASSTPANDATDVSVNTDYSFTFNEPIQTDAFNITVRCALGAICPSFGPPVWSNADQTVTLKSKRQLEGNKTYTLNLSAKDKAGGEMAPTAVRFTTGAIPGTTAPTVTHFSPDPGARAQDGQTTIDIVFSKPMNVDSLKAALTGTVNTTSSQNPLVISSVIPFTAQSPFGFGYVFHPQAPFDLNTVVQWAIGTDATDADGNHLAQAVSGSFSMFRQFTLTVLADQTLTGEIYHVCDGILVGGCHNDPLRSHLDAGITTNGFGDTGPLRIFISFDLPVGPLQSATAITGAILTLKKTGSAGDPFAPNNLGTMALERTDYGPTLDGNDFDTRPRNCFRSTTVCSVDFHNETEADGSVDVLSFIKADLFDDAHGGRSQYRLRFANTDSHNGTKEARLTYDPNPTLIITYIMP